MAINDSHYSLYRIAHASVALCFYRAMHFSAKRGLAIACLSVRPSVTLVDCDHISWNSSEIISPLVSLDVRSLQTKHHESTPRETPGNFGPK